MKYPTNRTPGHQLRVGDTIHVWWQPGADTITELKPYDGPLRIFPEGASLASFKILKVGMAIEHHLYYDVVKSEDTSMKYPTKEEIDKADRVQLGGWVRYLPSPGRAHIDSPDFTEKMKEEVALMSSIMVKFHVQGGWVPAVSKEVDRIFRP